MMADIEGAHVVSTIVQPAQVETIVYAIDHLI